MTLIKASEYIKVGELVNQLDIELSTTGLLNLDNLVQTMYNYTNKNKKEASLEIYKILLMLSPEFIKVFDDTKYSEVFLNFNKYINLLLDYHEYLMTTGSCNFDNYVAMISKMPSHAILEQNNLFMTIEDIQHTMRLLNEAVRKYYEIYNNKVMVTTFTDEQVLEFRIKQSELAHILGVSLKNVVKDPKYVDIFHITQEEIDAINDYTKDKLGNAAIEVLHKIVELNGDNLVEMEYDRIKKLNNHTYGIMDNPDRRELLRMYSKINIRSKAFIDFKPFEEMTIVLSFPPELKIIKSYKRNNPEHKLLIGKNSLSSIYSFSTLISTYDAPSNRRFFESLLLQHPEEIREILQISKPALSTSVVMDGEDGTHGVPVVFSEEQQLEFLNSIANSFGYLNLQEIYDYFNEFGKSLIKIPRR